LQGVKASSAAPLASNLKLESFELNTVFKPGDQVVVVDGQVLVALIARFAYCFTQDIYGGVLMDRQASTGYTQDAREAKGPIWEAAFLDGHKYV
jgi:hypothetical protein